MGIEIYIVNFSYLLTFFALAIREILWLRIILTLAQFGHLTHAFLNNDYSKGIWTIVFVMINIYQIIIIYRDRQTLSIPEEIVDLYNNIFHTKTNREFLNFWDCGKLNQAESKKIISAGEKQPDLMLILNGSVNVVRENKHIATLERGQFIAEISFITGNAATADVICNGELIYYVWKRSDLDKLRKNKPAIMNKLDRILTLDMAGKLTR